MNHETHAVTGAYGFSGKYIARRLLAGGREVITLTNSMNRSNPFGDKVRSYPFNFDNGSKLAASLSGVTVLYNSYWVRFNHPDFTYATAVENSLKLFQAAKEAGVKRIVHISITNPSEDSPYEYFRGKAKLERALTELGLSYAILRPAVLFGKEGILINNIAWVLRRFPCFFTPGNGSYRLQPIYVDDLAMLAVDQGKRKENVIINAIGPETFTFRRLISDIGTIIGKSRLIIPLPPVFSYLAMSLAGKVLKDVIITWDEIRGLMDELLFVDAPPTGPTRLTDWMKLNAKTLGVKYSSELSRRKNRQSEYEKL